jgi:membrane protein
MNEDSSPRGLLGTLKRKRVIQVTLAVKDGYQRNSGNNLAATITFFGFLSIFPLLLLGLSITGFVLDDVEMRIRLIRRLANTVPGLGEIIRENVEALTTARAGAGILGVVGLAWSGIRVVEAAEYVMARIFQTWEPRKFLLQKARALEYLVVLGSMTLVATVLAALAGTARSALGWSGAGGTFLTIGVGTIAFALDLVIFLVAYRVLYRGRGPRFSRIWPGALLAATGWLGLKVAGSWYAARSVSGASEVYGTFASVVGLLLLLYLASRLFVSGAVLNAVLITPQIPVGESLSGRTQRPAEDPSITLDDDPDTAIEETPERSIPS